MFGLLVALNIEFSQSDKNLKPTELREHELAQATSRGRTSLFISVIDVALGANLVAGKDPHRTNMN
jgi:hypothetical protein